MRVGLVVPHIFMHEDILPHVIFSPGNLALDLADGLTGLGTDVTLLTPGPVPTKARNITADLSYFEEELRLRGDTYLDLLKKHPFTFITLARQVQSEIIARAFAMANKDEFDVVHIYTNEEDIALPFAKLCRKPVIFTHHDPFNFLVKYKHVFPKHKDLNWLSLSLAQRQTMPADTNWIGNIYHGLAADMYAPAANPSGDYLAYLGRIIEPKGVHLAIAAVQAYNTAYPSKPYRLKIAGKHYSDTKKDTYWHEQIKPMFSDPAIEYVGFIGDSSEKQSFLANAAGLIIPSTWDEPFGMVMIEALACGTPIIGLDSGAIPEVIKNTETGILSTRAIEEKTTINNLAAAISNIQSIDRAGCRKDFESRFTLERMCREHIEVYSSLSANH